MSTAKTVGFGEAVGVILSLIGTGIQMRWPDQKWLGWVFIAAGIAVGFGVIVWALAIRHAHKQFEVVLASKVEKTAPAQQMTQTGIDFKPHIEVKPTFTQSQEQSQKQSIAEKEKVPPKIECADCYFTFAMLSGWNRLSDDKGQAFRVAQADFYLKPIPGSDPWIELRSQLVFYDEHGSERLKRISDGVWREQGNYIQMPIRTGDTRRLVIVLDLGNTGLHAYQYAEQHLGRRRFTTEGIFTHALAPRLEPLNADALTVQVSLVGKYLDDVALNQEFWFRLSRSEHRIEQIASPRVSETEIKPKS